MMTRPLGALRGPLAHPALFGYPRDKGPRGVLRIPKVFLRAPLRNLTNLSTYLSKYLSFTLSYSSYPRNLTWFLRALRVYLGRSLETFGGFLIVLFLFLGRSLVSCVFLRWLRV